MVLHLTEAAIEGRVSVDKPMLYTTVDNYNLRHPRNLNAKHWVHHFRNLDYSATASPYFSMTYDETLGNTQL